MIVHLFNSSSISGPERLVLPALASLPNNFMIVNLVENRVAGLLTLDPLENYARSYHLPYQGISVRSRWDRGAIRELKYYLSQLDPDLVHVHSVKGSIYLAQAKPAGRRGRIPIVSTHHGVHGMPDCKTRLYEWLYRKYSFRFFDRVLAVSNADFNFLARSGNSGDRLRLHLNGIDGRWLAIEDRPKESQRVRSLWMKQESERDRLFLFGVIGRLSAEKDHARLLEVLSCLNQLPCQKDWRCLIFGTGALEQALHEQTQRLGLNKRVLWMGYRNAVGDELAGFDLVLSFSKAEGLPINLIEAGLAGTPLFCTRVGGITDLIPDENFGNWVSPNEAAAESAERLQGLLSDEGERKLKAQSRLFQERVAREFSQKKWTDRLEEIYSELNVSLKPTLVHSL